jgi:hypothetical protein
MPTQLDTADKGVIRERNTVSQLEFVALSHVVERKRMYGLELVVIISATLAQAFDLKFHPQ